MPISRQELLAELSALEELFSEEYEQYAQRVLRDNEAVHNVRGPIVDFSLWNDTQVPKKD